MPSFRSLLTTALCLSVCKGLPSVSTEPILPSQDPWYTAPGGFEQAKPGEVLRIRPAPGNLTSIVTNSSAAYNILYRTSDTNNGPSWAVTTLFVPNTTPNSSTAVPLLSYQSAYDTCSVDGSPSYILYDDSVSIGIPADSSFISRALGFGWFVTVPDYEGPLASFTEGPQSGHAVLDSIRAATSLHEIFGSWRIQPGLWGYSGGAFATAWATELQSSYAPDLALRGAAVGGLPANMPSIMSRLNNSTFTGNVVSAVIGLVSQFPDANSSIANNLRTEGTRNATGFWAAKTRGFSDNLVAYYEQDVEDYFVDNQPPLDLPIVRDIRDPQTILGLNGVPQIPYFAFVSVLDAMVGVEGYDTLVDKYCAEGASILYQRNSVGGHIAEVTNSVDRVFGFLGSIFDGSFALEGCKVENVTVAIVDFADPL